MKILILPSFYPNSYRPLHGIFFRDHALSLQSAGHKVIVLAIVAISFKDIWKQRKISFGFKLGNDTGITTYLFEFPSIPKLIWLNNIIRTLIGWKLYSIIRQQHGLPNLIHVHSFLAGDLARKIKRQDLVPYAITEHSTAFARSLLSPTEKKMACRVFRDASIRTAVSMQFKQLLTEQYGLPFLYTPNPVGINTDIGEHLVKKDSHKIRICNVAYIDAKKRQDRLILAFNSVINNFPNVELHIAGDGPDQAVLEKLVAKLGLRSHVKFHGLLKRQDVFKLMRSCDIFALSSDYETFGVVLIEAMACGLPVVATKCGGPESIVTEEWLGRLTKRDDKSFTQGLLDVIKDLQAKRFDSFRISKHARTEYSYEAIGKRMTDIILSCEEIKQVPAFNSANNINL